MIEKEFKKFTKAHRKAFKNSYTRYDPNSWITDKYTWKRNIHLMIYQLRHENNFINKKTLQ